MNLRFTAWTVAITLLLCPTLASAQESDLIKMIVELASDSDPDIRSLAFDQIRTEAKSEEATTKFAALLDTLPVASKTSLISALADRGDVTAKAAILKQLEPNNEQAVRVAAIRAIAKLGDSSDCQQLTSFLTNESTAEMEAARTSLIQIQGSGITQAIATQIDNSPIHRKVRLIEVLAARRAMDTIPQLLKLAVNSSSSEVRASAMAALGQIGGPEQIPGMVQGVLKAEGRDRTNAERSISFVCNRIENKAERATPLLAAIKKLSEKEQTAMLVTLGRVGGPQALAEIEKAIASKDGTRHSRGLSALASWPDASVAEKLEHLAYNDPHLSHQLTALRALIRIAPLADGRSDADKLALLKRGMEMSHRVVDRQYALQRASAIRIPETLRWVLPFIDDPRYAETACRTIVELAHIRDLRDDNKAEFHAALGRVQAVSKNEETLERARRYKAGKTWVRGS